jgi:hypothetical protein
MEGLLSGELEFDFSGKFRKFSEVSIGGNTVLKIGKYLFRKNIRVKSFPKICHRLFISISACRLQRVR